MTEATARVLLHPEPGDWIGLIGRLLLFVVLALGLAWATALLVPQSLPWGALPGLVGALVAGRFLRRLEGRPRTPLGFTLDRRAPRDLAIGLALGLVVAAVAVALMVMVGVVGWRSQPGDAAAWLAGAAGTLWLLAIPAAAEEALLRGYPLQTTAETVGPAWALGLTSLAFAALHIPNPDIGPIPLVNLALAGVFLGVVYLRTASLWCATGAHLGWNWALTYPVDLPLSGLELIDAPLIEPVLTGPTWLSGGGFGPEGSVLAALALGGAAAWAWRTRRLGRRAAEPTERQEPGHGP